MYSMQENEAPVVIIDFVLAKKRSDATASLLIEVASM